MSVFCCFVLCTQIGSAANNSAMVAAPQLIFLCFMLPNKVELNASSLIKKSLDVRINIMNKLKSLFNIEIEFYVLLLVLSQQHCLVSLDVSWSKRTSSGSTPFIANSLPDGVQLLNHVSQWCLDHTHFLDCFPSFFPQKLSSFPLTSRHDTD